MKAARFLTAVGMIAGLLAFACARPAAPWAPVRLETAPAGADTRVTLLAPGLKVNARLKPALELPDGSVLRFDSTRLTPDSAYFIQAPSALLAGSHRIVRGTLKVSVCHIDEQVCRLVTLQL